MKAAGLHRYWRLWAGSPSLAVDLRLASSSGKPRRPAFPAADERHPTAAPQPSASPLWARRLEQLHCPRRPAAFGAQAHRLPSRPFLWAHSALRTPGRENPAPGVWKRERSNRQGTLVNGARNVAQSRVNELTAARSPAAPAQSHQTPCRHTFLTDGRQSTPKMKKRSKDKGGMELNIRQEEKMR